MLLQRFDSLGRRSVNFLPVAQRTNALTFALFYSKQYQVVFCFRILTGDPVVLLMVLFAATRSAGKK